MTAECKYCGTRVVFTSDFCPSCRKSKADGTKQSGFASDSAASLESMAANAKFSTQDFAEPTVFFPNKKTYVYGIVVSLLIAGGSILAWMLPDGGISIGLLAAGVTVPGICAILLLINCLPGASWIRLDATGITQCSAFRQRHYPWCTVTEVGIVDMGKNWRGVAINLDTPPNTFESIQTRKATGFDVGLLSPAGMSADQFVIIIESYRQRNASR